MRFFLAVIVILFFQSCSGPQKLSNQNLAYLYSTDLNFIYPEYKVYNLTEDSSRVFFRINPNELLFMKSSSDGIFKSAFAINYRLLPNYESKIPVDTGTMYFTRELLEDSTLLILDEFDVRAPDSNNYVLEITLTDLNRKQAVSSFLTVDRTGIQPAEDFIIVDPETNMPYVKNYTDRRSTFKILNYNSTRRKLFVRYFNDKYPLSTPPFSNAQIKPLSYFADAVSVIDLDSTNTITLEKTGIYHFQFDTLVKEGFTVFRFEEDFPKLTSAENLIESIRFLTTRQEYDKIVNSSNKKEAVDDYWLAMAGNRERARVLIRSYYSRVQSANLLFTSYLEGWKSDRGLIYIIFGPPNTVYRTNDTENWNYSQTFNYGPLNFTFEKIKNPFTSNDYLLRRSTYYEMPWYRAVDSWRDGRVVNDNY
ncbi:MAG TPA: GWxTD domain-containing protein [Bacteroidia bacterium]|nr:GWxTD domain-containing protein [Bacteroidia bacterium]